MPTQNPLNFFRILFTALLLATTAAWVRYVYFDSFIIYTDETGISESVASQINEAIRQGL